MNCSTPSLPVHHQLLEFTQTHAHWVGDAIQPSHLCRPLLFLPPIPPSIRVFSNESTLRKRWPKYWSFNFSVSPSNEHPWLISFRMDWLDLLSVQGTLKSLFQHRSSKASIFRHSAFFTVQFSHPYMTTGKTIALTRWTFVGNVSVAPYWELNRVIWGSTSQTWKWIKTTWASCENADWDSADLRWGLRFCSATGPRTSVIRSVVSNSLWPHGL